MRANRLAHRKVTRVPESATPRSSEEIARPTIASILFIFSLAHDIYPDDFNLILIFTQNI